MNFFRRYPIVPWLLMIGLVLSLYACSSDQPCKDTRTRIVTPPVQQQQVGGGSPEVLYDGHVRDIDWNGRSFVYESGYGYVKTIGPVCGREMLPIWKGMHVYEINFHWDQPSGLNGCFQIDYVGHAAGVPGE